MRDEATCISRWWRSSVGMLGLAAAMGIGRFAFTPLMPLMQAQSGLTLAQGGWLAAANYAGYFAGALLCVLANPRPGAAARAGLAGVALFTLAMGADRRLRVVAGLALRRRCRERARARRDLGVGAAAARARRPRALGRLGVRGRRCRYRVRRSRESGHRRTRQRRRARDGGCSARQRHWSWR